MLDFSKVDEVINRPTGMRVGTEFQPPEFREPGIVKFGRRWFPASVALTEDIAYSLPETGEARTSIERLRISAKDERLSEETRTKNAALADELERTLPEKPTAARWVADIAENALYAAVPPAFKAFKAMPGLQAMARGALFGSAYGVTSGIRQKQQLEDILTRATMTGVIGAGVGLGSHLILSQGVFKVMPKLYAKVIPLEAREAIRQRAYPLLDLLSSDFGEAGQKISRLWKLTRADAGVIAGEPTLKALEAGIMTTKVKKYLPLTEEDAWTGENSLYDVLTGKSSINKASERVQKAAVVARDIYNTYGGLADVEGVLVGKRENYMTQITPVPARVVSSQATLNKLVAAKNVMERETILLSDKYKNSYLRNAVQKLKEFSSIEGANDVLESWGKWVLDGGRYSERSSKFISWMVESGRAKTMEEAQVLAKTAFSELWRPRLEPISGFIEKHRDINFPFFNPDPRVALPAYIMDVSGRLAYLRYYGVGGMATLLREVETTQGAKQMAKAELFVRNILGTTQKSALYGEEKAIASFLKGIQTPKLSFSAITNLGQSLNTLLSSDMKSLGYGLRIAFTDKGFQEAMKSGAILQSVMHKVLGYSGGGSRFGDAILKYSGFSWSEMFNRTVASNAGGQYFEKQAQLLAKFPDNPILRARIEELGGDVAEIIARGGSILEGEKLRAMNIFSAKTQFLSDAASLPMFMSSPWGQVFFQFKNYAYNQTRFVLRELGTQWAQKNYGRFVRDLAILGLVFPIYGEISADIRATFTGAKRPKTFLARYFNSLANAGAFGLAFDIWQTAAFGKTAELAIGPTFGTATGLLENLVRSIQQEDITPELRFVLNQTGFGRIITGYAMPPKTRRKGYGQWWEFYEDLAK